MKNRLNPWVVVLTAALTFGSLMAFVGPRFGGHYRGQWSHRNGHDYGNGYGRNGACARTHQNRAVPNADSVDIR